MEGKLYSIWIEAEEWAEENINEDDNSTDVMVKFDDGSEWVASFITYQNIISLSEKNEKTGECLNGDYFWASDMILVKKISRDAIERVIKQLILDGEFDSVFSPC